MKTIAIIINFYVAILLTIIPNGVRPDGIIDVLNEMAAQEAIIDGIFKPFVNGSLGPCGLGIMFKGLLLIPYNHMEVAMKFSPMETLSSSNNEYEMFTYLGALNDPSVNAYGIPSIYYYGKWNDHTMLAMTLLDSGFQGRFTDRYIDEEYGLIALREFVKTIKYIHGKGIIYDGVFTDNMLIQDGHGFIYDFSNSRDMAKTIETMDKSARQLNVIDANMDFARFFDSVSNMTTHLIDDFGFCFNMSVEHRFRGWRNTFFHKYTLFCSSPEISDIMYNMRIPDYDKLYDAVVRKLKKYGMKATSSLSRIQGPFGNHILSRPTVKYDYFEEMYATQIRDARKSIHQEAGTSKSGSFRLKNLFRKGKQKKKHSL